MACRVARGPGRWRPRGAGRRDEMPGERGVRAAMFSAEPCDRQSGLGLHAQQQSPAILRGLVNFWGHRDLQAGG